MENSPACGKPLEPQPMPDPGLYPQIYPHVHLEWGNRGCKKFTPQVPGRGSRVAAHGSRPLYSYPHPLLPLRPHEMGLSPKLSTSVDNFRWKTFYPVENPGTPGWPGFFRFLSSSYAQGPDKRAGICYTILIQPLEPAGSFSIQRCGNIAGRRLSGKPPGPWRFSSCSGNLYHIEGCPP